MIAFLSIKWSLRFIGNPKVSSYLPLTILFHIYLAFFKMTLFNDSKKEKYTTTLTNLEKVVLCWNYHVKSKFPKKKSTYSRGQYNLQEKVDLTALPKVFLSYTEYFSAFKPMIILECWEQLQKSKWENNKPHIAEFARLDKFKSGDAYICVSELKIKMSIILDDGLYERDLIVISYFPRTAIDSNPKDPSNRVPYKLGIIKNMECVKGNCLITVASINDFCPNIPSECCVHFTKVMR